jgi:lipopolysaccharide/colanic/teichoic acid biosynthesis glycosyltransferase
MALFDPGWIPSDLHIGLAHCYGVNSSWAGPRALTRIGTLGLRGCAPGWDIRPGGFVTAMSVRIRGEELGEAIAPAGRSSSAVEGTGAGPVLAPAIASGSGRHAAAAKPVPWFVRAFEILVALSMLAITSPVLFWLAILIRRGTPGRALFLQSRLGRNQAPFTFVKFRTLYADARQRFPHLYRYAYTNEELKDMKFKVLNDPRVTPQGKWMRKTTLDELPNFWNVLTGDMALVGPRPEIPEMLPYYSGEMLLKFTVRPGITGLAQISGRGRLGFHETVRLDVEYVKRQSLMLDLTILFRTVWKAITQEGAF